MTPRERQAIVSIISNVVIFSIYCLIRLGDYPDAAEYSKEVFSFWASFILWLIPVSVVSRVIIDVIFSVLAIIATGEEDDPDFMDERDRLLELKAARNAAYVFALGFILAMVTVALEMPPSVMFFTLILAGVSSDLFSELSLIYFYRRGS